MAPLAAFLCLFCSVIEPPAPDMAHAAGDIWYRHEVLSGREHLLRLSTTDLILDTNGWRKKRITAFAENFAARTCDGRYKMIGGGRITTYAANVMFRCV